MRIHSFEPIIDKNSKILILGSIPSEKSLQINQYYGNPRNQFWKLLSAVFGEEIQEDYTKKITFLRSKNIALWDVISCCYREGSLDTRIKNPAINDFAELFKRYPKIKCVFLNGKKAEGLFLRNIEKQLIKDKYIFGLPSSSPASTMKFEDKMSYWKKIKECETL